MKRKIAIAAGILVTAVSTISGSYAYYQDSVTVTNHISTGDVNIKHWNPGIRKRW